MKDDGAVLVIVYEENGTGRVGKVEGRRMSRWSWIPFESLRERGTH
jgi:hypothetical protein